MPNQPAPKGRLEFIPINKDAIRVFNVIKRDVKEKLDGFTPTHYNVSFPAQDGIYHFLLTKKDDNSDMETHYHASISKDDLTHSFSVDLLDVHPHGSDYPCYNVLSDYDHLSSDAYLTSIRKAVPDEEIFPVYSLDLGVIGSSHFYFENREGTVGYIVTISLNPMAALRCSAEKRYPL